MSKAEQRALEAYPLKRKVASMTGVIYTVVGGYIERGIFQEGYEQAEKDTIEKVCEWLSRHYDIDLAYFRKTILEEK